MRAQVEAYKKLARNEPLPSGLAADAIIINKQKSTSLLPEPYEYSGQAENGDNLPYDLMKVIISKSY